jgi:acetoin utilization deacetylase AcuC-like enzyme
VRSSSRSLLQRLRRGRRRLDGWLRGPQLELVYSDLYKLDLPRVDSERGSRILAALDVAGLLQRAAVHRAEPASFRDLRRIHADRYLDSMARPETLLQVFGLALPDYTVERAVECQRAMVGGTLLATRLALASGRYAANLGGGLHHAFPARGERFCIFNDVAVAIAGLRADGFVEPILVVDLDLHDDDGTRSIFALDRTVHTFSIHNRTTTAVEAVAATTVELGDGVDDRTYLAAIGEHLPRVFAELRPELVYYLAGCDPAADDAIGNWRISAAGLLRRDRLVIELARRRERRLPVVILLAGGYGEEAWRYSARFFSALRPGGEAVEPPTTNEVTLDRYRRLDRELFASPSRPRSAASGSRPGVPGADWQLTEEDLLGNLGGPHRPRSLLGTFSRQQIELTLGRAGLLERLRQLGFRRPTLELDVDHPGGETLRIYGDAGRSELLAEVRLRVDRHTAPGLAVLRIEWLQMQNPHAAFTPARPRLPGQEHPGLGLLRDMIALLIVACERAQLDGLLWVPAHYHTAAQGRRLSRFLHAADEGLFRALAAALGPLPLAAAVAALEQGRVRDASTGAPFVWRPMAVVVPVSGRLREQLEGAAYEREATAAAASHHFVLAETSGPAAPARAMGT